MYEKVEKTPTSDDKSRLLSEEKAETGSVGFYLFTYYFNHQSMFMIIIFILLFILLLFSGVYNNNVVVLGSCLLLFSGLPWCLSLILMCCHHVCPVPCTLPTTVLTSL